MREYRSRRYVSIALLFLIAVLFVLHLTRSAGRGLADELGVFDSGHSSVPLPSKSVTTARTAKVVPSHDTFQPQETAPVRFLLPRPVVAPHLPAHLERALEDAIRRKGQQRQPAGDNTVEADAADIDRARSSLIRPLPLSHGTSFNAVLYNTVKDFMQSGQVDAAPVVVDFGCTLGEVLSASHPNATVLCIYSSGSTTPSSSAVGVQHPNLFRVTVSSFTEGPFLPFYKTCNLISNAIVAPMGSASSCVGVVEHLRLVMRMAKSWFAVVPTSCRDDVQRQVVDAAAEAEGTAQDGGLVIDKQWIAEVRGAVDHPACAAHGCDILMGKMRSTKRFCTKTWGAPLEQWGRKLKVQYDDGLVRFEVVSKEKSLARAIDPLQYIASINFESLLAMGIEESLGTALLGQMVQTPRYSDPLPHNWIVAGGGKLLRIDKVDLRYDSKVDEKKGYWGHSTQGYLHLFGHHLCLPLDSTTGLPQAMLQCECRPSCVKCTTTCSYLPKGSQPCDACMQCGDCLQKQMLSHTNVPSLRPRCQLSYSSMDAARKEWRKWEKRDRKPELSCGV